MGIPIALIQLDAGEDVEANLAAAVELTERAASEGARIVALPENLHHRGHAAGYRASARPVPGATTEPFAAIARRHGAWILLGSIAEQSSDPDRPFNASVLLAPDGRVAATYRKVHLFDATIDDGTASRESRRMTPGDRAVTVDIEVAGSAGPAPGDVPTTRVRLGLSICYDVRFPELYRTLALEGAEILTVPAYFTERTGRDHWEPLLRARAIENGAYVIAPAQCGTPPVGYPAYGHSLVVDPWGLVVACASDGVGIVHAQIDPARVVAARRQIPALANRRPDAYRLG